MKETRTLILDQAARRSGGDRYEEQVIPPQISVIGKMYVLQSFSRKIDGTPANSITVTLERDD